jgi:hypothetical protein
VQYNWIQKAVIAGGVIAVTAMVLWLRSAW